MDKDIKVVGWSEPVGEEGWVCGLDIVVTGDGITVKTTITITQEDLGRIMTAIRQWEAAQEAAQVQYSCKEG